MKTLGDVQNLHWEDNSLPKKIEFKDCLLSDIQTVSYATISCLSGCQWSTLTEFMFGLNGVTSEFVFLDALCVNPMDKGPAMTNMRWKIMEHSHEHHIIELRCLREGKIWHDLAFIDPKMHPTVHYSTNDLKSQKSVIQKLHGKGFESFEFSGRHGDVQLARDEIIHRWETMENFNRRVQDIVDHAFLEFSQKQVSIV